MHIDIGVMLLVLVLGCATVIFGVLYAIARVIGTIGRVIWSVCRPTTRHQATSGVPTTRVRICPQPQCRSAEYRDAVYCSQCGALLMDAPPRDKL